MSLTDDVMEACLLKAIDDTRATEAMELGMSYIDLIKFRYEENINKANEDYIKQLRLKGM